MKGRNVCRKKKHNQVLFEDGGGLVKRWHCQLRCVEGRWWRRRWRKISLHGCIRITPSDTEDLTKHQLRTRRNLWSPERNVQTHAKLSRTKEGKERGRTALHPGMRELKQGSDPHIGAIGTKEKHLRLLDNAAADLRQSEWNENHTIFAAALHIQDRDTSPLEHAIAGSWSIRIGEKSQGEVCWLRGDGLRGHEGGDCSGKWL